MTLDWDQIIAQNMCRITPEGTLVHPGLHEAWGLSVAVAVALIAVWGMFAAAPARAAASVHWSLSSTPFVGPLFERLAKSAVLLSVFKFISVILFLMVIWSGLAGTPLPERNLATVLTWNLWWSGVIVSVFFLGSAWCAICPWDALSNWLVRRRLWKRADEETSLGLKVPKALRNVWPAVFAFVALTWLELGVGLTSAPYATAVLALTMLVLASLSMAIFERKAFCRFACPVGRTIGFYAQLAPVELRPKDPPTCATCKTLECYHGSNEVDPCPTHQVMGRMTQNTFCTSCGNCARSCPHENIGWRLRPPSHEVINTARPHWDEAWFMVILLALTGFHGLTMMEFFEDWMRGLARMIGDSGQLLMSFSIAMVAAIVLPVALYSSVIWLTHFLSARDSDPSFHKLFASFAFVALPLAFFYHLAHNLSHLLREGIGAGEVFANPLGYGAQPLSIITRHARMNDMALTPTTLATLQALLLALGFLVAVLVIRARSKKMFGDHQSGLKARLPQLPILTFAIGITIWHLWLLMQPMVMRS
ncbi:MAG: 4Fe-4S binding protein [Hyphomicrobiaceae bacterium]|nr:4Fe-4S binding protein [Hyphomicrobiaceae bacterium]